MINQYPIPDLIIHEVLHYFDREEKLNLRFVNKQWKFNIDRELRSTYNYECRQRIFDHEASIIQRFGNTISSLFLDTYNFQLHGSLLKYCTNISFIHIYVYRYHRRQWLATTTFNNFLRRVNPTKLKIIPELPSAAADILQGVGVAHLKLNCWLLNHNEAIALLNNLDLPNLRRLKLKVLGYSSQLTSVIERKFPKLTKLSLIINNPHYDSYCYEPLPVPQDFGDDMAAELPKLEYLEQLKVRSYEFNPAIVLPGPQDLPCLRSLELDHDGRVVLNRHRKSHYSSVARVFLPYVNWLELPHTFPKAKHLSLANFNPSSKLLHNHSASGDPAEVAIPSNRLKGQNLLRSLRCLNVDVKQAHIDNLFNFINQSLTTLQTLNLSITQSTKPQLLTKPQSKTTLKLVSLKELTITQDQLDLDQLLTFCTISLPRLKQLYIRSSDLTHPPQLEAGSVSLKWLERFVTDDVLTLELYQTLLISAPNLWHIGPTLGDADLVALKGCNRYLVSY